MKAHVSRAVSSCFNVLRQIRSIRRSVTSPVLQSLVASLVLSRLDYGNAALAGLPAHELSRLQSVQNAGVRLTFSANKYDHVSSLLRDLHWLREPQQIEYKIAVLVYRCLHGLAPPAYLSVDLYRATRTCRSSSSLSTFKCRLKTELFSRSFPDWCDCVNVPYICKVACRRHPYNLKSTLFTLLRNWCRHIVKKHMGCTRKNKLVVINHYLFAIYSKTM